MRLDKYKNKKNGKEKIRCVPAGSREIYGKRQFVRWRSARARPDSISSTCTRGTATPRSSTARPSPATRCLSSASSWSCLPRVDPACVPARTRCRASTAEYRERPIRTAAFRPRPRCGAGGTPAASRPSAHLTNGLGRGAFMPRPERHGSGGGQVRGAGDAIGNAGLAMSVVATAIRLSRRGRRTSSPGRRCAGPACASGARAGSG